MNDTETSIVEDRIKLILRSTRATEEAIDGFLEQVRKTQCHDLYQAITAGDLLREFDLETNPRAHSQSNRKERHSRPNEEIPHGWVMCSRCHFVVLESEAKYGTFEPLTPPEPYCDVCVESGGIKFADFSDNPFIR
jgi:hypothetical protein